MNLRPIKNDADYAAALAEVSRLFDARPETPESDLLEILTTLVEVYEDRKYDIPLPDRVEAIKYHAASCGLSLHELEQHHIIFIRPELAATPITQKIANMNLSVSDWSSMEQEIA